MQKENEIKNVVCDKLRELRKQKGYTQQEISELLHMSQNAYSELETGKRKIDIERLNQFTKIFNIPVSYFLDFMQQSPPNNK